MRALVMLACLPGCAQLFGLENTTFDQQDAPVDASGVCDTPMVSCTNSPAGRSVCGQLFNTGANAGTRLRVAAPTGELCAAGNTEGPCALAVTGSPLATYFDGTLTGQVQGLVDDCGRYVVGDLDPNAANVAIVFTDLSGTGTFHTTARLVIDRPTIAGIDTDVDALAVLTATTTEWANQLDPAAPPDLSSGYLVTYRLGAQTIPEIGVALDSGSALMNAIGTVPWAGYFSADRGFGTLDPAATGTSANGTALAVLPTGPFSLEGVRTGKRCRLADLESVAATLIHVIEDGC